MIKMTDCFLVDSALLTLMRVQEYQVFPEALRSLFTRWEEEIKDDLMRIYQDVTGVDAAYLRLIEWAEKDELPTGLIWYYAQYLCSGGKQNTEYAGLLSDMVEQIWEHLPDVVRDGNSDAELLALYTLQILQHQVPARWRHYTGVRALFESWQYNDQREALRWDLATKFPHLFINGWFDHLGIIVTPDDLSFRSGENPVYWLRLGIGEQSLPQWDKFQRLVTMPHDQVEIFELLVADIGLEQSLQMERMLTTLQYIVRGTTALYPQHLESKIKWIRWINHWLRKYTREQFNQKVALQRVELRKEQVFNTYV